MFNAPNSAIITGRQSTVTFTNPNDPVTATNLPYDAEGNLIPERSLPRGAGFGVANAYQARAERSAAGALLVLSEHGAGVRLPAWRPRRV